jgi:hypothetical protein
VIAVIAGFLARRQAARPMAGCGSERTVVGRTPAAIVVQVPAVSIGRMEGAGTTLTNLGAQAAVLRAIEAFQARWHQPSLLKARRLPDYAVLVTKVADVVSKQRERRPSTLLFAVSRSPEIDRHGAR